MRLAGSGHRLLWPLPALLSWVATWLSFAVLRPFGLVALLGAAAFGVGLAALAASTRWRRLVTALGFPLSLAASGLAGALPAWAWLIPLALLFALYPLNAWRDAPLFPTPAGALRGLSAAAPLATGASLLDAGCGVGDGLIELARTYPGRRIDGIEWSWPLAQVARLRCRRVARVRRDDIWATDWAGYDLVYLFQRPESMPRAWHKAVGQMRPGSWLASLEFAIPGIAPTTRLDSAAGRPVWLYRVAPELSRQQKVV